MRKVKKHYIFDLDDTLIDSYSANRQLFINVFDGILDVKDKEITNSLKDLHDQCIGGTMRDQFEKAIEKFSLKAGIEDLLKKNEELQLSYAGNMKLFAATKELMTILKKKRKILTICSNRQLSTLTSILKTTGIDGIVENVISCSDIGHAKPDPFCLNEIVLKYNSAKEQFIYFGDSKTDKIFAEAAGIDYLIIDNYLNKNNFYKLILQAFIN
jgi:FMN phosphatase YigB (HAD superfamily)